MLEQDLKSLSGQQIRKLHFKVKQNLAWLSRLSSHPKRLAFRKENVALLFAIDKLRKEKKAEALKIFYSLPKETRGVWHTYKNYGN